jgi:acyl carrier protein
MASEPTTVPATRSTLDRVKKVLRTSLNQAPDAPMDDDMKLVGGEFDLDSLDILLIVTNLEKEFAISVREGQMDKAAFTSVRTLADFAQAKHASQGPQATA